jgi:hypothetical protein
MKPKVQENNIRSTVFEVIAPSKAVRQKVINSIRDYRAVARLAFSAYTMAQIAGATIKEVNGRMQISSNNAAARTILAQAFNAPEGKAMAYELRTFIKTELRPTWLSKTWDSMRLDLEHCWRLKDPEKGRPRGFLILSGQRGLARFAHRGISFSNINTPKFEGHTVRLIWDHEIGEVEFKLPRLDGGRYAVWRCLRDEVTGWERGTMYLTERDGKLKLVISHRRPIPISWVDQGKVLTVEFGTEDVENFITMYCTDETFSGDKISAEAALSFVKEMDIIQKKYENQRRATGNPHKQWGTTKIWNATVVRQNRATKRRANGTSHWNHVWTRRIINHAQRLGAGSIVLVGIPVKIDRTKLSEEEQEEPLKRDFFDYSWPWAQLRAYVEYKAKEIGAVVQYATVEDIHSAEAVAVAVA